MQMTTLLSILKALVDLQVCAYDVLRHEEPIVDRLVVQGGQGGEGGGQEEHQQGGVGHGTGHGYFGWI